MRDQDLKRKVSQESRSEMKRKRSDSASAQEADRLQSRDEPTCSSSDTAQPFCRILAEPVSTAVSQQNISAKQRLFPPLEKASSDAARFSTTSSELSNGASVPAAGRSTPNTSAAHMTPSSLPKWRPYTNVGVARHLGFSHDNRGHKEWTMWIRSSIVASHYRELQQIIDPKVSMSFDPSCKYDAIDLLASKHERFVAIT